jgi:hypothetical protein
MQYNKEGKIAAGSRGPECCGHHAVLNTAVGMVLFELRH